MRVMAGLVEPDAGERFVQPGRTVAYLPQDPDPTGFATLLDYAAAELAPEDRWRAEAALDGLKVAGGTDPATASGGERRRAALARLIAAGADLMLLDEPTNHLDIAAIEWLEEHLDASRAAFALISHDRAFLTRLSRATLWIDRGEVRRAPFGFAGFEEWRDKVWEEEDARAPQARQADQGRRRTGRSTASRPGARATRGGCAGWRRCAPSAPSRSAAPAPPRWRWRAPTARASW